MDVSAKNPQILQNVPNEEKFSGGITLQIKSWRQNLLKKGKRKKEQNSFFSLVLIRSGVCHIHQNSHTLSLQQGELAILPPDKMYAVERYDADSIIETICLKPTLTAFFLCSEYVSEELETASGDTALNSLFFDEVRTILLNGTPDAAHLLSLSVYNFFRKMNECSGRFFSDVIFQLIQQINSHPEKDYSQNTLKARYQGFFFTLQRLFRKHHKCSIYEYVFQTRMNLAEQLLIRGGCSVKMIAEKCGYRNFSFFCREFKRIHGVPPGEFHQQKKQKILSLAATRPHPSIKLFRKLSHHTEFCEDVVYVTRDWMPFLNLVFPRVLHYGESELKAGYFFEAITPIWLMEYIKDGNMVLTEIQTGKRYPLEAGTLFILEPDQRYRYEVSGSRNVKLRYAAFNRNILTALMLAYNFQPSFHVIRDRANETEKFLDAVSDIVRRESGTQAESLSALTYSFLLSLLPSSRPDIPDLLNEIINYIQNNISLTLKLSDLAAEAGYSVPTVNRLFKKYLNCTPAQYIFRMRMIYAEKLLRCQDLSIQNISVCCGFRSFALFSKNFRQYHGCTPHHFRKKVFDTEALHQEHPEWFKHSGNWVITHEMIDD